MLYCPFPLFHLDAAMLTVMPALVLGTTAAIGERFSASGFWHEVRRFGATVFDFMGATLTMLHEQPARPDDGDNPARLGWGVPVPDFAPEFEARFGVQLVELYGSTDAGIPVYQPLDEPRRPGSCGKPIAAYDVELHDESGTPVPVGETGEIVVRPNEPCLMSDGYFGMAEAIARVAAQPVVPHRRPGPCRRRRLPLLRRAAAPTRSAGEARTSPHSRWRRWSSPTPTWPSPPPTGYPVS